MATEVEIIKYDGDVKDLQKALRAGEQYTVGFEKAITRSISKNKESFNALGSSILKATNGAPIINLAKEVEKLSKQIKAADEEAKKTSKSVNAFGDVAKKVGGAIAAVFAVDKIIGFAKDIFNVTSEFQKLEAVLSNTLGSKSLAQKALSDIKNFAAVTPFSVQELTQAYVKLANQGFKPTLVQLRQLGDLASSTGKGFDQLTEAIIDAQTGEFERLKEFGIRASKEGDKVSFTFKGVKTQTDFTNQSIRDYITSLGDLEGVSGAMAAISGTLGGALSNLGDKFDNLLLTLGEGRIGKVFAGALNGLSSLLDETTSLVKTFEQRQNDSFQKRIDKQVEARTKADNEEIDALVAKGATLSDAQNAIYNKQTEVSARLLEQERNLLKQRLAVQDKQTELIKSGKGGSLFGPGGLNERKKQNDQEITQLQYSIKLRAFLVADYTAKIDDNYKKQLADQAAADAKWAKGAKERADKEKKAFELQEQQRRAYNDLNISLIDDEFKREGAAKREAFYRTIEDSKKNLGEEIKLNSDTYNALYAALQKDLLVIEDKRKALQAKLAKERLDEELKELDIRLKKRLLLIDEQGLAEGKSQDATNKEKLKTEIAFYDNLIAIEKAAGKETVDLEQANFNRKSALKNLESSEEDKKYKKIVASAEFAANAISLITNEGFNRRQAQRDEELQAASDETDKKIANLDRQRQLGEISEAKYQATVKRLQDEQARREKDARIAKAKAEKNQALFNIAINTAVAVIKAVAESPATFGLPFSAFALATGAIEAAIVASRPLPKYAKGVINLQGEGTGTSDSITARLSKGESVMTAKETAEYGDELRAIRGNRLDDHINKAWVMPAINKLDKQRRTKEEYTSRMLRRAIKQGKDISLDHLERLTARNRNINLNNVDELADAINKRQRRGGII